MSAMGRWLRLGVLSALVACGSGDDGVIDTDEECLAAGGSPTPNDGGTPCRGFGERIGGATWHGEIEGVSCCRPVRG